MLYRIDADGIRRLMADDYDSFAFSPESKSLAAWYPDHTLRILGLPECRESKRFELPNADIDLSALESALQSFTGTVFQIVFGQYSI